MVGIATLSDMVPLIGENRVLAAFGMAVLKKSRRKGLVKLFSELGMRQQHLTEDDIAFMVTPRINAASRMGVPMDAFHLLCAKTEEDAQKCFDHLDHINNQRKGIVASLVKEIKKTITDRYGKEIPEAIVLGNPEWRPSLLGLAANTCAGEFHRPVFLWGRDGDGGIKGSCRSEGQSSVVKIMRAVEPGILGQFGGHYHSGGFAVSDEGVYFLEQKIVEACQSLRNKTLSENEGAGMTDDDGTRDEFIDQEITIDDVDRRLENEIVKLSPFGKDNPRPLFLFRRIAPSAVRVFGKAKEHIELIFERGNRPPVGAVKFFASENEWANKISAGSKIDLVASIEKSYFRGREDIRLRIEDVNIILF
jgi:single-stranded-DNA-specific exonuclease